MSQASVLLQPVWLTGTRVLDKSVKRLHGSVAIRFLESKGVRVRSWLVLFGKRHELLVKSGF